VSDLVLYKFQWDCGRMGTVRGVFAATKEKVNESIGKDVYFGEILGKHSEVHGTLDQKDLVVLTEDQNFISKAIGFGLIPFGYSPLEYLVGEEEDEDEGEDEDEEDE